MGRRTDYISFFGPPRSRHRDFVGFDTGVNPRLFVIPSLVVGFAVVAVWWFAFRHADEDLGGVLTLEDATIPTLLLPSGAATDDAGLLLSGISLDCEEEVTDWESFQASITHQGCVEAPTITNPVIEWRVYLGIGGWLNSPVIHNGTIYLGTAGSAQATEDSRDGVYAYDLYTGKRDWYFGTSLDVNGVAVGSGVVVATGDEGRVWGIDAVDGSLMWDDALGVATFGYPLILSEDNLVVIGDASGLATAYNLRTGDRRWQVQVDGAIRGGAASNGEVIVFAGENRDVVATDTSGRILWRTEVVERDPSGALARVWAAPTIVRDMVVVTMLREDLFVDPAITALDLADGTIRWQAQDAAGIKHEWGSIRSSVAAVGDVLVYGEPYSNLLVAIEIETGQTVWDVTTGAYCFPHWPSPAVVSGQVILPRHDGGLYAVSVADETLAWQIFLGDSDSAGGFPPTFSAEDFCEWGPKDSYSILSSPAVAPNGYVVVTTLEGYMIAIADRSWG